nr:MAG TPA: hypothetical protein [Caudoviricetes sp.]
MPYFSYTSIVGYMPIKCNGIMVFNLFFLLSFHLTLGGSEE